MDSHISDTSFNPSPLYKVKGGGNKGQRDKAGGELSKAEDQVSLSTEAKKAHKEQAKIQEWVAQLKTLPEPDLDQEKVRQAAHFLEEDFSKQKEVLDAVVRGIKQDFGLDQAQEMDRSD